MSVLGWAKTLYDLAQKVQALFDRQEAASKALVKLEDKVRVLQLEVKRLKAREEVLVAKAEAAASAAASAVAMQSTADLARRLGGIEARVGRLPPPEG